MSRRSIHLVGTHEIRVRLGGISRQRVYQITQKSGFPKPVENLAQGAVWLAADVDDWIKEHRRPAGQSDPA